METTQQTDSLTFQQAMTRLQTIVNALNNPNLELENAMDLFREGLNLSRQCEEQLKTFEKEMQELLVDHDMQPQESRG